jgi:hypothetical protein
LNCSHKACEELAARRAFNSWRKIPNKKRAEYTKTEATELKELDDKNSCGRKKERKKELGIPQKQQRYNLQRYAEL